MGVLISRYFALLKNEYMQVKLGLSILVAVHIMYQLIYFFSVTYLEDNPLGILIALTFFFFSYLYPVYFLYSLHSSSKKRSFDTVHLLAVPKWLPVFFRFLIVLYAGIIMQCLTFSFYFYSIVTDFKESFSPMFYDPRFYAGTLISMISVPFVTLSIACVIWGVIQAVKRYRAITAVAVGIFAHAGYSQLFKNKDWYILPDSLIVFNDIYKLDYTAVTMLVGSAYIFIGLILYNRYADV